jgi:ubiquinol-cytochrome c reductase cytochrome c1 subunit
MCPVPAGLTVGPNQHYNAYMSGDLTAAWHGKGPVPMGGFVAMPPPLAKDKVSFDDKTPSDAGAAGAGRLAFLAWAADPKATERKQFGLGAMIYLFIFAILLWFSYKRVWKDVDH